MKHEQHEHNGEPCSCGHDHSEPHQHHDRRKDAAEPCACGHDHSQHPAPHENQHEKYIPEELSITHHENAVIVSAEREISGDYTRIKEALSIGLKSLAGWVENQNGLVGHIKAHLSEKGGSAMLSTTGDEVQIRETANPGVLINLAVIVFVENEVGLTDQVSKMLKQLC
ncbi:hypothetical protein [Acetobacterium bakii]|uniref:Uncharacterized protein n=1 Tax=Acetobacterium bakii TaxID=52689 RepID=A0A0L6TVD6_9FIRM|nr:hypothetical protein [Acetobacterium bakii]KNZ40223.1 hypothetical protein AKG39_18805 [Acetobacterium bakii]